MDVPMQLYGSESWVINKASRRAVEAAEMKFLRYFAGCACKDQISIDSIREKLKIFNLNDRTQQKKRTGTNIFYVWIQEDLPNRFYNINQKDN
jgi:hypothetical protein